jgi:hypothetical protein
VEKLKPEVTAGKAEVSFAVVSATKIPAPEDFKPAEEISLPNRNVLWIKVASGKNANYYRLEIYIRSNNSKLGTLKIGDKTIDLSGVSGGEWDIIKTLYLKLDAAVTSATVTATPAFEGAKVRIAKFDSANAAKPEFTDNMVSDFSDGDFFAVEVTAENKIDKTYYKFELLIGREPLYRPGDPYTVPLTGLTVKNPSAFANQYDGFFITLPAYPDGFDIADYNTFTLKARLWTSATEEVAETDYDYEQAQVIFLKTTQNWNNEANQLGKKYNINVTTTDCAFSSMDGGALDTTFKPGPVAIRLENSIAGIKFIQLTELSFK